MPLTSGQIYWLNMWTDIKEPIDYIYQTYCLREDGLESRHLYAYGVSLGASMLLNYIQYEGDKCPLKGVCSFGAPYNLKENVSFFKSNGFRFYDFSLGYYFYKNVLVPHLPVIKKHVKDEDRFYEFERRLHENRFSMMDMDQNAIIPFFGFANNPDDYYRGAQTAGKFHMIKVPTLCLSAYDDPCFNPDLYPFKEFDGASDYVALAITKRGSHCCHLTGGLVPTQWHPSVFLEFLEFIE